MATFDLRDLPRDSSGRLITGEDDSADERRNVKGREAALGVASCSIPSFAVDVRKEILTAVMECGGAVSRAQIAKLVKREKSTWLDGHIEWLVEHGHLTRHQTYWKNGVVMFFYEANR